MKGIGTIDFIGLKMYKKMETLKQRRRRRDEQEEEAKHGIY